ncbi:hypothetical protein C8R47DRAFT_513094, partial [Mycena vitilis]
VTYVFGSFRLSSERQRLSLSPSHSGSSFLSTFPMSVLVSGVYTSSVATSLSSPATVLSSEFVRARLQVPPHSRPFAFTVNGGPHGSFTTELFCTVSPGLPTDVCLGLDWKAGVREWMIGLGLPPPIGFDHVHAIDPLAHAAVSAKSIHLSDAVAASRPSAPGLPPAPSAGHLLPFAKQLNCKALFHLPRPVPPHKPLVYAFQRPMER